MDKFKKIVTYIGIGIFVVIIVLVTLLLILKNIQIKTPDNVEAQEILLFKISLDNWSTILTSVGLLGTAIWSMFQYSKSKKSKQQEKSTEIARRFSDELLGKCDLIIKVFRLSKLSNLITVFSQPNFFLEDFTCNELREITENDDFPHMYTESKKEANFDNIYYNLLERRIITKEEFEEKYKIENSDKFRLPTYSTSEAKELFILDNQNLPFHFYALINEVLNDLEAVCMDLSSNAADSNYIYPSLHQIFFDTVNTLSIEIALRNNGKYSDKFYTNITHVYTKWKEKYIKSLTKEIQKKHKSNQLLSPKIKTVF